jgi:CHAD domain-containing protein
MVTEKETEHILATIFNKISRLLREIDLACGKKQVHLFRIEIKRLKAILLLLNTGKKKNAFIKIPRRLKSLYFTTGKIRESQLLQEKLKSSGTTINSLKRFRHQLKSNEKPYKKKLCRQIKKTGLDNLGKKLISQLCRDTTLINPSAFFTERNQMLHSILFSRQPSEEDLHSARKNIKDVLYVNGFLNQYTSLPAGYKILLPKQIKDLENIANQLGLFNDLRILISQLKTKHLRNTDYKEFKNLQSLKKKWKIEKEIILEQIQDKLKIVFPELPVIS